MDRCSNSIFPINTHSQQLMLMQVLPGTTTRHGRGIWIGTGGNLGLAYNGEWRDGRPHGAGVFAWRDGSTYAGSWSEGAMHGDGMWWLADGRCFQANPLGCVAPRASLQLPIYQPRRRKVWR